MAGILITRALSGVFVLMGVLDPQYTHLIMESDR